MVSINVKQLIARAERARQKGSYESAIKHAKPVFLKNNQDYDALLILGLSELGLGNFAEALGYGQRLIEVFPSHPNGAMIASVALMSMRQNKLAVQVLEKQLERNPNERALLFNLHSAYGGMEDQNSALKIALDTVGLFPTDSDAFNNLGATLSNIGRRKDAVIAFQTAVDLKPSNLTARLNLIHTKFKSEGNDAELISEIESIKAKVKGSDLLQKRLLTGAIHNSAFAYFRLGRLKEGWEALEAGLNPEVDSNRGRKPTRNFRARRWKGEPLNGKTLMVWREQGLGDEIMFGSMLPELNCLDGKIIIESEPRLVEILQNSFPKFNIRSELYRAVYPFDSPKEDFDYQIPIASLGGIFRNEIKSFSNPPHLIPLADDKKDFGQRIESYKNRGQIVVGLCWRSGVVSPTRGSNYTLIEDWRRILENPKITVVNLQYGKCEDELLDIENRLGVEIVRWSDISLQNDQGKLAAIIANLDYVFSIGSAVAQLAGAVGTRTGLVAIKPEWTSFGTKSYPFASSIELFCDPNHENILVSVDRCISAFENSSLMN